MRKLLVIADPEGAAGCAIPRGLELADKLNLQVEVVAFIHVPLRSLKLGSGGSAALKKRLLASRREDVQDIIDGSARAGQRVKLNVVWEKDIADWVTDRCTRTEYAMVVKTGHRSETLAHTSTDWVLLRECPAPIVIVAERKWSRTRPVMASLDLASKSKVKKKLNRAILEHAAELAEALGVEMEIICAVEVPPLLSELDLVDDKTYVKHARQDMAANIRSLAEHFGLEERAFRVKRGPVEKVITSQAASRRAQLVVMGCVGRKGVKARLLGNTAEKVLRHLRTDVLALKP